MRRVARWPRFSIAAGRISWFYRAHGYRFFKRNILHFVSIRPVRRSFVGLAGAKGDQGRRRWLARVRKLGQSRL